MTKKDKEYRVKLLVSEMLRESYFTMVKNIDTVLQSEAIDIDAWDDSINPMILPKCITAAILQRESVQYEGIGTSFEKQIKKEIRNIKYFL